MERATDGVTQQRYVFEPSAATEVMAPVGCTLDKPLLIGECHFGSDDRGPFGKGVVSVCVARVAMMVFPWQQQKDPQRGVCGSGEIHLVAW